MNLNINEIDIFQEAGLLKTYIGGMSQLQKLVCEKFKDKYFNSNGKRCAIGCCYNSTPMYARLEEDIPEIRTFSYIGQISSPDHPALAVQDDGKNLYDKSCPKIAWGFSAFILPNAEFDNNGKITSFNNFPALCDEYFNLSYKIYKELHKNEYNNAEANNQIDGFNSMFAEKHLNEERKLLNKSKIKTLGDAYISATHKYYDYVQAKIESLEKVHPSTTMVNVDESHNFRGCCFKTSDLFDCPTICGKIELGKIIQDLNKYVLRESIEESENTEINLIIIGAYFIPIWKEAKANKTLTHLKCIIQGIKRGLCTNNNVVGEQWYEHALTKLIEYYPKKNGSLRTLEEMKKSFTDMGSTYREDYQNRYLLTLNYRFK